MSELLQKALDAAIQTACRFYYDEASIGGEVSELKDDKADELARFRQDAGPLQSKKAFIDRRFRADPRDLEQEDSALSKRERISGEPMFPEGPSEIVIAHNAEGVLCRAAILSEKMIKIFGDIVEGQAKHEAAEVALRNLKEREWKLEEEKDRLGAASTLCLDEDASNDYTEKLSRMENRLDKIADTEKCLQRDADMTKLNIEHGQAKISEILHKAFQPFEFIAELQVPTPDEMLAEYIEVTDDDVLAPTFHEAQQREVNAEEQSEEEAKNEGAEAEAAFQQAQNTLMFARCAFEEIEEHNDQEDEKYEQDVAAGEARETRTEFGHNLFLHGAKLTEDLIQAERYCDEKWWELCDMPDQDFQLWFEPMKPQRRKSIEQWLKKVDKSQDPSFMPEEVDMDSWDFEPPDFNDSFTTIDGALFKHDIALWHRFCEEQRQHFREEHLQPDDIWTVGCDLSKRRRSYSY